MIYSKSKSILSFCLAIVVVASVGCGGAATVTKSATPKEAFENMTKAAVAKDWKTFCGCMTPDSIESMAGGMAMLGMLINDTQGMGDKDAAEKIAAVMKKFNVSEESVGKFDPAQMGDTSALGKIGAKVKNKAEFIGAIMSVVAEMENGPGNFEYDNAAISDIKIDGDLATGKATGMGPSDQVLKFKKIDGNWLIDFDLNG